MLSTAMLMLPAARVRAAVTGMADQPVAHPPLLPAAAPIDGTRLPASGRHAGVAPYGTRAWFVPSADRRAAKGPPPRGPVQLPQS